MDDHDRELGELTFRSMASSVHAILVDPSPGAPEQLEARLQELERLWSRFDPSSDLSRLMAGHDREVTVAPETLTLLAVMVRAHSDTGGRYDPTMLREVLEAGYTTSVVDPAVPSVSIDLPSPSGGLDAIRVDPARNTIQLPRGLGLDPGGIGKGLAADLVVAELLATGTSGAMVSIGGDLVVAGVPPDGEGWTVQVEDPFDETATLLELLVDSGGVATSSTLSRRWSHRGSTAHHVLDPLTGTVARTDVAAVTALAPTGWQAEVHATAALVSGRRQASTVLGSAGCSGVVVPLEGSVSLTPDLGGHPVGGAEG